MKKFLLSLFLCLTLGTAAVWAAELKQEYSIDLTTAKTNTTAMTASNFLTTVTGASDYVKSISTCSYVYPQGSDGIKFASSKQNGTLEFTLNDSYCVSAKEIVFTAQGSKASTTLQVTVGGVTKTFNLENQVNTDNVVTFDTPTDISTIKMVGASGKQIYVKSITVYTETVAAAPEAITATIDGEAIEEEATVANGTVVTFESKNAGALLVNDEEVANPYEYTVDFGDAKTLEVLVEALPVEGYTPAEGEEMPIAIYTFTREAAALCGTVEFDPAGGEVLEGSVIKLSCDNAVTIMYAIDGGAEKEYDAEAGITINDACTLTAYGINGDGIHGEAASVSFTIKEADRYKLITSTADLKSGAKYIIVSAAGHGLGAYKSNNQYAPVDNGFSFNSDKTIITLDDDCALNILTFTASGESYTIEGSIDGAYFTTSGTSLNKTTTVNSAAKFAISFSGAYAVIGSTDDSQILYNVNSPMFRHYKSSNATATNYERISLYRLIDEEYIPAPEELHLHGDFFDASWERSIPMERNGNVFTAVDIMIGHQDGGHHYLLATFPKTTPNESTTDQIRRRAATISQDYWAGSEGHVFIPNADGTLTRTHTSEITGDITPAEAEKLGRYYDLTADFSGFTPTFAVSAAKDNPTTGIDAVETDANAPVEYYNLQGIRVADPTIGLYIRRQGSATTKVYIR